MYLVEVKLAGNKRWQHPTVWDEIPNARQLQMGLIDELGKHRQSQLRARHIADCAGMASLAKRIKLGETTVTIGLSGLDPKARTIGFIRVSPITVFIASEILNES